MSLFPDEVSVQRVKDLYEELMLPHTYDVYEEESYKIITTHIQQISRGLPHKLFFTILDKIYRRKAWEAASETSTWLEKLMRRFMY